MNRQGTVSAEGTSAWERRLRQCFAGLDAAIHRHRDNRGRDAVAAFAAAAEAAMWSTTLDDFYWRRHPDKSEYSESGMPTKEVGPCARCPCIAIGSRTSSR